MDLLLGIDGGGTHTRCQIASSAGSILGYGQSDGTNPNSTSLETLCRNLHACIMEAVQSAGIHVSEISTACLGIAGGSSPEAKAQIRAALAPLIPASTQIEILSDAEVALYGAHLGMPGIIVIAGTGSVCFGQDIKGAIHRSGGLGPQEKDGGSAKWIHRELLELQGGESALRGKLRAHGRSTEEVCPDIFEAAEAGDHEAAQLIGRASDELYKLIESVAQSCGQSSLPITMLGGLLYSGSPLRAQLSQRIASKLPSLSLHEAALTPVAGALLKARQNQKTSPQTTAETEAFIGRLKSD